MSAKHSDQVAIFWDFENCRPSSNVTGSKVLERIRCLVQGLGCITTLRAYVDISLECTYLRSNQLYSELQSSGCTLVHCPHNGKKDVADKMMIVDMLAFAMDKPAPANIVIVTGDRDFTYAAAVLRLRGYRIVIIAPQSNSHGSLKLQADQLYEWQKDVLEACGGGNAPGSSIVPGRTPASHRSSLSLPTIPVAQRPSNATTEIASSEPEIIVVPPASVPEPEEEVRLPAESSGEAIHSASAFPDFQSFSFGTIDAESLQRLQAGDGSEAESVVSTRIHGSAYTSLTSGSDVSTPSTGASLLCESAGWDEEPSSVARAYSCVSGSVSGSSLDAIESALVGGTRHTETSMDFSEENAMMTPELTTSSVKQDLGPSCSSGGAEEPRHHPVSPIHSTSPSQQQRAADPPLEVKEPQGLSPHAAAFTPGVLSPTAAAKERFQTLITLFVQRRESDKPIRIISSEVGSELKKRDPKVYEKAGVEKLKSYLEEARNAGIVVTPGLDGNGTTWVEINPMLYKKNKVSVKQESEPSRSSEATKKLSDVLTEILGNGSSSSMQQPTPRSSSSAEVLGNVLGLATTPQPVPTAEMRRFLPLITLFIEQKYTDSSTRIKSSDVATALLLRDPELYKKAGVSKLKDYIEEARRAGVVVSPGLDRFGSTWVELNPLLYDETFSRLEDILSPDSSSLPERNPTGPAWRPVIDAIYVPLVDRLCLESPSYRLLYSTLGTFVKQNHPNLYERASVSGLSAYLEKAEEDGIIVISCGTSSGSKWAELRQIYRT